MKKCGNCKYAERSENNIDLICSNEESELFGIETDYDECCVDFEREEN